MKKFICFTVAFIMIITTFCVMPALAGSAHTYGVDNLNNSSGDLVIGYIGGSITEGAGSSVLQKRYSTLVVNNYFKVKYPNKNVIELNAAIGGTGSGYGMTRMYKDLRLNSANTPDVVFIEFAVNDAGGGGMGLSQNMESMVRQLLALPKIPVIIFVYTTSADSVNMNGTPSNCVENAIASFHNVAQRYGIYDINLNDYVWNGVVDGKWSWNKDLKNTLTVDNTHPNDAGYKVYADRITECLNADKDKAFVKLDPDTLPYGNYIYGKIEEIPLSDANVKLSSGWSKVSYTPIDTGTGDYVKRFFREGYYETSNCVGQTIEYDFTGRGVGLDLDRTKNSGTIEWKIYDESGNLEKSGTHTNYYAYDTGRCCGGMIVTGLTYGKHKLVMTGALNQEAINDHLANSAAGGTGTYLGIAYIVVESQMPVITPRAGNVKVTGTGIINTPLSGSYTYSGSMYSEGASTVGWYISNKKDGTYALVQSGKDFTPTNVQKGSYVKFGVTPINTVGTTGSALYSEPILITRPVGVVEYTTGLSIKVNDATSDKPGVGKNTFSATLANNHTEALSVTMYAATYSVNNGIKTLTGVKKITKSIGASSTADFSVDITATVADSIISIYTICDDDMESVVPRDKFEYIGVEDGGVTVYRIKSFE